MPKHPDMRRLETARLPLIKCECGAEILLVPDAKVMGKCIEVHLIWHKQRINDPEKARLETERVRDYLIVQILKKACQQSGKEDC